MSRLRCRKNLIKDNISFDKIKVTTMTHISRLNCNIKLELCFNLFSSFKEQGKLAPEEGDIIFYGYKNFRRGENSKIKLFKNAITLLMKVKKGIIVKIFPKGKIHICGTNEEEEILRADELIKNKFIFFKEHLEIIKSKSSYEELYQSLLDFVKSFIIVEDNSARERTKLLLESMNMVEELYDSKELFFLEQNVVMRNYNYYLGFKLSKEKLHRLINETSSETGLISHYDPAINHFVRVILLSVDEEEPNGIQQFLIFSSGSIIHNGKNKELMKEGYYKLLKFIEKYKSKFVLRATP
jgi:hypothetical protein